MLNCHGMFAWLLRRIYYYVIVKTTLLWNVWMSIMNDLLLCDNKCYTIMEFLNKYNEGSIIVL